MLVPDRRSARVAVTAGWAAVLAFVAGCASEPVKTPSVQGGHPAQGMVTLTYAFAPGEPRTLDWNRAGQKARQYCRENGYARVEPVGKPDQACKADNRYRRCTRYFISRSWQCRGEAPSR